MVIEEISAGLKNALERGQSLKSAMMSFYNAGYEKGEIEEAARALAELKVEPIQQASKTSILTGMPVPEKKPESKPIAQKEIPTTMQKVSNYGGEKRSFRSKIIIITLVFLLFLLVGTLVAIFLFKDQLISLLNTIF